MNQVQSTTAALITGASSGIGYALARVMARNGHNLVLVARDQQRLHQLSDELRQEFEIEALVIAKDLSEPAAAQEIVAEVQRQAISIDILVNNAGLDVFGNFYETDMAKELHMIQVNLVSLTALTKYLLADMRQQRAGRILNVGSTGSFIPSPLNAVYSATKAYVLSFSEAIAEELQGSGITVTVLCPGATRTEFHKRASAENIRLLQFGVMDAEAVARIGYHAMLAGRRVVVPGLYNQAQVLFARFLPGRIVTKMAKVMLQGSDPGAA
jgi:short-subunit dehydrogenase